MKTKTFLLLCLFLGIAVTQVSAQNKNRVGDYNNGFWLGNNKGQVTPITTVIEFYTPVYCNGNPDPVDFIGGTIYVHNVLFYTSETVLLNYNQQFRGDGLRSINPLNDEVFKFEDREHIMDPIQVGSWDGPIIGIELFHYNLIGNKGTHYEGWGTYDFFTYEITSVSAKCFQNDNK